MRTSSWQKLNQLPGKEEFVKKCDLATNQLFVFLLEREPARSRKLKVSFKDKHSNHSKRNSSEGKERIKQV